MATTTTTRRTDDTTQTQFEARTQEVVDLKRLIRHVESLMDEAPVVIDTTGIKFKSADAALVALVDLQLKPELFNRFHAPEDAITFNIDVEELKDYITEANQGDDLTLAVTEEPDGYQLHLSIWHDGVTTTFTLDTMDPDDEEAEEFGTDELEYTRTARIALDQLVNAIDTMDTSIDLRLDREGLQIDSDTGDTRAAVEIPASSDYLHAVTAEEPATSSFSVDYLASLKKLKRTIDRVYIAMGTDYPLRLETDQDRFRYRFYLAPRIEEA